MKKNESNLPSNVEVNQFLMLTGSGGQELSYTHYTPINTIYSLRNRYLSVA